MPLPAPSRAAFALAPLLLPCLLVGGGTAWSQTPPSPSSPAAAPAAPSAARPAAAASAPAARPPAAAASAPNAGQQQRIEITGGRNSDTEQRRQATASKIVIGREEIDKFGDATVGEVLRRLPGVTTPGAPGRGGPPRMRGLGGGFTQLLIDGQRVPPGFSLESLTPEQVERIEILRAPTAETGARAIAGTINIITREGFRRRLNDLRLGFGVENGQVSPGVSWNHNDSAGNLIYTLSASVFGPRRENVNESHTRITDAATGALLEERVYRSTGRDKRVGANLNGRLQWRLGEGGDSLSLMPMVFHNEGGGDTRFTLQPLIQPRACQPGQVEGCTADYYTSGTSRNDSRFTNARLGWQYRQRIGGVRWEGGGGAGSWRSVSATSRNEFGTQGGSGVRTSDDRATTTEQSLQLNLKATALAGGADDGSGAHSLVAGAEIDGSERDEFRRNVLDGQVLAGDFGENLSARALRLAAFVQDEWQLSPRWGLHAGLRWEGITTRGDTGLGERPTNRSSVWTPLVHAVFKPDPKGRDQLRISLTRSYRSPGLGSLIARPTINRYYPVDGPSCAQVLPGEPCNTENSPDSAGNPALQPELATGIDIAIERYLEGGGVLSANLFHREISNLFRGVTAREANPAWSPGRPRWVRRTQNIGDATTTGIELEAKFRLDQLISGATPVELRTNLSVYDSKVKAVPGPDNRLDQQARATANLGADYRLRGTPLTLGGNVNWVPATTTRIDEGQTSTASRKTIWDAYALWTFNPHTALRLLGNNLDPRDHATTTVNDTRLASGVTERATTVSGGPSFVNWQLRLELKL
jgi:outer membrane receptor for ferrienterochelin and colicins